MSLGNTAYQVLPIRIPFECQLIPVYSRADTKEEACVLNDVGPQEVRNLKAFAPEGSRVKYFPTPGVGIGWRGERLSKLEKKSKFI